jgi:hypothetical protein
MELKYNNISIIKKLKYVDYEIKYVENNYYNITKKDNIILNGCIIKTSAFVSYRNESYEFLGINLIIYYPKKICTIM